MTLTGYILIAIPICILTILIWTYFDYKNINGNTISSLYFHFCFLPYLMHNILTMKTAALHSDRMKIIKEN